jgi:hypothetical protein
VQAEEPPAAIKVAEAVPDGVDVAHHIPFGGAPNGGLHPAQVPPRWPNTTPAGRSESWIGAALTARPSEQPTHAIAFHGQQPGTDRHQELATSSLIGTRDRRIRSASTRHSTASVDGVMCVLGGIK